MPETGTREAHDRIRAAILNSAPPRPSRAITVNLLRASLSKRGTSLDLAIAIAVLTAVGVITADAAGGYVLAAGLGLDGRLCPVPGVLPMVLAGLPPDAPARSSPPRERRRGRDGARRDRHRLPVTAGRRCPAAPRAVARPGCNLGCSSAPGPLVHLAVPPQLRLALEVSAAGRHHLGLTAPPGTVIPAVAQCLAGLLPPLSEALEVSAIHSAAGLIGAGQGLITRPPYQAPHHTVTRAAMLGGGPGVIPPGEPV